MPRIITLGTSAALPCDARENTYLLLEGDQRAYLVDCAGSPVQRLRHVGMTLDKLEGLIVTHHHPDHIYGVPTLLSSLWLSGRQKPFHIYGLEGSIRTLQAIGGLMGWETRPDWISIIYHCVPQQEHTLVLKGPDFRITGSPGEHLTMETLALRVEARQTGRVVVYSSDTGPCEAVAKLAQGAEMLIHEATGPYEGHSTAAQAGAVARQAQVQRLVLVHYPRAEEAPRMIQEAKEAFAGPVEVAGDFAVYEF